MTKNGTMPGRLGFRMLQGFRSIMCQNSGEIYYIGGAEVLPVPLNAKEEAEFIHMLACT